MCPSFTVILVAGAIYLAAWTFYVVHLTHSSHLRGIGSPAAPAADVFPSFDVHGDRRSYTRLGASLPPVPDVAVYFNCWGKDLQYYLAFPSIVRRINASTARYIYITSGASATQDATAPAPCDLVSNALFEHLSAAFPCTTVVYRRRTRADTVRALLQLAPTAICASAPSQQPSQPPQHNNICSQLPPISPDNDIIVTTAAPLPQVPPQPSFSWFPPRTPKPPPSPADTLLAELRSDSRAALGSRGTTVVTAFYRISSKYSLRTYDGWIANFMRMGFRCVVYGDDDAVAYMRARWPATADRVYVVRPLSAFTTARWDWSADEDLDPEQCVGHGKTLYQIWNEKPFLVADAARRDPFRTATFAWVDVGCFREADKLPLFRGFPDATKVDHSKVTFLQIEPFRPHEKAHLGRIDGRFARVDRIGGGIFMGDKRALRRFAALHAAAIDEAKAGGVFAGKDQSLFAFNILRHPEAFDAVLPEGPGGVQHDRWMMLQLMWAAAAPARPTTCRAPAPAPAAASTSTSTGPGKGSDAPCDAFFLILSTAGDRAARDAIRRSWLTDLAALRPALHPTSTSASAFTEGDPGRNKTAPPKPPAPSPPALAFTYKFVLGHPHDARGRTRAYARTRRALSDEARLHPSPWASPSPSPWACPSPTYASPWASPSPTTHLQARLHGDLLLLPFVDDYWNLTVKVGLALKWPSVLASGCRLLVKVDADVYIRAGRFAAAVAALPPPPTPVYGGWVYDQVHVVSEASRDPRNRHSLTRAEHPNRLFEPYAGGPVYFLSRDVAAALPYGLVELVKSVDDVEVVPDTYLPPPPGRPALYKLEDAYLGTLVRRAPVAVAGFVANATVAALAEPVRYVHVPQFFADARTQRALVRTAVVVHGLANPAQILNGHTLFN